MLWDTGPEREGEGEEEGRSPLRQQGGSSREAGHRGTLAFWGDRPGRGGARAEWQEDETPRE